MKKYPHIGVVHSKIRKPENAPRQPFFAEGIEAEIEIFPEFQKGLEGLEQYKKIIVIFQFHLTMDYKLKVIPHTGKQPKGVFATRSPNRPAQIGMSIVNLKKIEDNFIYITNADMIDGTPVIDIKPFIPELDCNDYTKTL